MFDDLQTDADELNRTSSSDDLVISASDESMSEIESSEEDLQQQVPGRQKNHSMKAEKYQKCYRLFLSSHLS